MGFIRTHKYHLVAPLVNGVLLIILFTLWYDGLERIATRSNEFFHFFTILVSIFFSFGFVFIYLVFSLKKKITISVLITLSVSFFADYNNLSFFIENRIIHKIERAGLVEKYQMPITLFGTVPFEGFRYDSLDYGEYEVLQKVEPGLPDISKKASNISTGYEKVEFFLPDYSLSVEYFVPLSTKVGTFSRGSQYGYSENCTYEIVGKQKKVVYWESKY